MNYDAVFSGLLHDIGKFFQRAYDNESILGSSAANMEHQLCPSRTWGYSHRHALFTYEFVATLCEHLPDGIGREQVALTASSHHKPETELQRIIQKADCLSSGMERIGEEEPESTGFRSTPLKAVTSSIDIGKGTATHQWHHRLKPLDPDDVFPVADTNTAPLTDQYRALWDSFLTAWNKNRIEDPWAYINRALSILEHYTWCIPSATYKTVPDISLFDHSKTTAAIAACLREANGNNQPYLFVAGDFSGIQDYIFSITKKGGGYAKRLRARSFYISLLSDAIALKIIHAVGLPLTQRIINAGGKFVLLLPNTEAVVSALQKIVGETDAWLLAKTDGDIRFSFATVATGDDGLLNFNDTFELLGDKLRDSKNTPYRNVFSNGVTWNTEAFLRPYIVESDHGVCATCGHHPARHQTERTAEDEEDTFICDLCRFDYELGKKLPHSEWVVFRASPPGNEIIPGIYCDLHRSITDVKPQAALLVKNITGSIDAPPGMPVTSSFTARHIPMKPNGTEPMTFDIIEKHSEGVPRLAYLKGDVDNLGFIFRDGFRKQGTQEAVTKEAAESVRSISRITGLSRMLDLFFAGYFGRLLDDERYQYTYTVYAGGDDFLCIGPWNAMIDLARRLADDFRDYCCHNPNWSLSMGLILAGNHTPVLNAVEASDDYLEGAKRSNHGACVPLTLKPLPDKAPIKNSFALFDTCIPWERFAQAYDRARDLAGWIADGTLTTSHVWRLRRYSELYRQYLLSKRDTHYLEYIPLLAYDLRRNWKEAKYDAPRSWVETLNKHPDVQDMKTLKFICEYALLINRGRQE